MIDTTPLPIPAMLYCSPIPVMLLHQLCVTRLRTRSHEEGRPLNPTGYTLYGMRHSYFTRKLEAAMVLQGIPFAYRAKTLEVKEEIERRAATNQIPVLHTPESWMIADSTPIVDLCRR